MKKLMEQKRGPNRDLNPGPPAPKAGIIATRPHGQLLTGLPYSKPFNKQHLLKVVIRACKVA